MPGNKELLIRKTLAAYVADKCFFEYHDEATCMIRYAMRIDMSKRYPYSGLSG